MYHFQQQEARLNTKIIWCVLWTEILWLPPTDLGCCMVLLNVYLKRAVLLRNLSYHQIFYKKCKETLYNYIYNLLGCVFFRGCAVLELDCLFKCFPACFFVIYTPGLPAGLGMSLWSTVLLPLMVTVVLSLLWSGRRGRPPLWIERSWYF